MTGPSPAAAHPELARLLDEARAAFRRDDPAAMAQTLRNAADRFPDVSEVHNNLGVALRRLGRNEDAVAAYRRAIELEADNSDAWYNLGNALRSMQQGEAAIEAYRKAVAARPGHADAHFSLGIALSEHKGVAEAVECFRRASELRPDFVDAFVNLGVALRNAGRPAEAIEPYRRAIALQPESASIRVKLGNAMEASDRFDEAIASFREAIGLAPELAEAHNGLGLALMHRGDPDLSLAPLRRALELKPEFAWAHTNLGLALLTLGHFEEGWREYEWRWQVPEIREKEAVLAGARWQGEDLAGRTLLLRHEQGMGDTLQFARYVPQLAARGARVVLCVQPPLVRLLAGLEGAAAVLASGAELPAYDFHCPLLSVPMHAGTTEATIPAAVPYLRPDPALVAAWGSRLPPRAATTKLRVGIAWAGKPSFRSDRRRSVTLATFAPLARLAGIEFVSLQKGPAASQAATPPPGMTLIDPTAGLQDFADTAALMAHLDLVISVDTAVVHLAGALAKPAWMLCRSDSEWRWLLGREDSPWYPTLRIFRQQARGNWHDVVKRMAAELARMTGQPIPPAPPGADADLAKREAARSALGTDGPARFNDMRLCRHGLMLYNRNDQYVGRSLARYGEFSEAEVMLFRQLLRPGDVVVEAGANIGTHTLFLARAVGDAGRVHAYEPQRIVFQTLCANLALNDVTNVMAVNAALGEHEGLIGVPDPDPRRYTNFGGLSLGESDNTASVPVETIDALALDRLRLLKADVEGMEADVLAGARETIRRLRPILYVENDRREKSPALIRLIRSLGYRMWWHKPPLFNPANFAGETENVFGGIVSVNLLCLPSESKIAVDLREVMSDDEDWRNKP